MSQICKKASRKLHALSRVSKYMDINKQIMLMNPFIISQFPHCPLLCMFHGRNTENRAINIHKGALTSVYNNNTY